jgi:multidrug efflux system membrane fusion protein
MKLFLKKIGQTLYQQALRIARNPVWSKIYQFFKAKYQWVLQKIIAADQKITAFFQPKFEKLIQFVSRDPSFALGRRATQIIFYLGVYIVLSFSWSLASGFLTDSKARDARNRPISVVTAPVQQGDITVIQTALGTVTPRNMVTVRAQVSGILSKLYFKEGDLVQAGQLLAQVDPRPFEAALKQAQGTLDKDTALLANAELDLKRYDLLLKQDSVSNQVYSTQKALVQQYKGSVLTDEGAVSAAKLQLEFSRITSPINGRIGLRLVDPGNLVQPSDANGLFVITQLQPTTVLFSVPQEVIPSFRKFLQDLPPPEMSSPPVASISQYRSTQENTKAEKDSKRSRKTNEASDTNKNSAAATSSSLIPVEAWSSDNKVKLATGYLESIDNEIDITTGTVKLRGIFANEDLKLFPNQFVNVRVVLNVLKNVVILPVPAILRGTPGTFVYRLNDDNTVSVVPVRLGPIDGDNQQVIDGLDVGNIVVVDGTDKLRNRAKVMVGKPSKGTNVGPKADGTGEKKEKRTTPAN